MKKLNYTFFTLVIILCYTTSCSSVILGWYGVKQPKQLTASQIQHSAVKYGADTNRLYVADTFLIKLLKDSIETKTVTKHISPEIKKELLQPLQYMLFDNDGKLIKFMTNCYAMPGIAGLRFDKGFDVFPPDVPGDVDSNFTFSQLAPYLLPTESTKPTIKNADYTCVVVWNRYMTRNTRRLIKAINNNLQQYTKDKRIAVYYVNNDDIGKLLLTE